MKTVLGKPTIRRDAARKNSGPAPSLLQALASDDSRKNLLNTFFEADPATFGAYDSAVLNLLCAPALPGSEKLEIPRCLARLDSLVAFVKASTARGLPTFHEDPTFGHCERQWRAAKLVTNVKLDFGAAYDPDVSKDLARDGHSLFTDSRNAFIHGLLDDDPKRRWGSCSSIPVLIAVIGRRLGYPIRLAVNRKHVYARWDDGNGFAFNIEASNPAGMLAHDDDYYRTMMFGPMTAEEERSGLYCRSLQPAEEVSLFLKCRVWSLSDAGRYGETLLWAARALQFSPTDPNFYKHAYEAADLTIKHRYRQKYPDRPIPPPERNDEFFFQPGGLLALEERSLFLTICGHYADAKGKTEKARQFFEDAARQNFHGNNEQRDLQRFLKKHGLKPKPGPLLFPEGIGQPRRMTVSCPDEHEADQLRRLADRFARDGEFVKARDALHDLYLFDPCDAEVFQRARALEREPRFQVQLKAVVDARHRMRAMTKAATAQIFHVKKGF